MWGQGVLILVGGALCRTLAGKRHGCGCGSDCVSARTCQQALEDPGSERTLMLSRTEPQREGDRA